MKLLHTGDLHLGKTLHEASLLEDQAVMLDQLLAELGRDDYAVLAIAGDVYDRTIPPAEAVELFSDFLVRIRRRFPDLETCIIPGNHDSAQRLSFADRILGQQRIHIVGNPAESFSPIIVTKNGEKLALFLLPFLAAGSLRAPERGKTAITGGSKPDPGDNGPELDFTENVLLSQAELAAEASRRFGEQLGSGELAGIPTVLVAHLFTTGGRESESERIFLGSAERVPPALFSRFSYVALGHLHRYQGITERMYYAGSPLAYSFDEADGDKSFLKVEFAANATGSPPIVSKIPVVPHHRVSRLSGNFADFHSGTAFDSHSADYLEITLTDQGLVANPMSLLRQKFPRLLSVRQGQAGDDVFAGEGAGTSPDKRPGGPDGEKRDPVSDFCRFEEILYGSADEGKRELFAELLKECADEA